MMGTANWRAGWRKVGRRSPLALITIYTAGSRQLNIATDDALGPDLFPYQGIIIAGSVHSTTTLGSTDVRLSTMSFRAKNVVVSGGDIRLDAWLAQEQVVGAQVFLQLWERSTTDTLQRFVGAIQSYRATRTEVEFSCMQDRLWNRPVRPRVVTRAEFPYADDAAIGQGLPVILGAVMGKPMRRPFASYPYGTAQMRREQITGGSRVSQALVVDTGQGGTVPMKVLVAGHQCAQVTAPILPGTPDVSGNLYGTGFFFKSKDSDVLGSFRPPDADIFNVTSGAGFLFKEQSNSFYYPVRPADVSKSGAFLYHGVAPAGGMIIIPNARAMLSPFDDTKVARMEDNAGTPQLLQVQFPTIPTQGVVESIHFYIVYKSSASLGSCTLEFFNGKTGLSVLQAVNASLTEASAFLPVAPGILWGDAAATSFDFARNGSYLVEFNVVRGAGAVGWIEIASIGLVCRYVAQRELIETKKTYEMVPVPHYRLPGRRPDPPPQTTYVQREVLVNVTRLEGKWYASAKGYPDLTGRYTGVASSTRLIERVPDLVHAVLGEFGGVPLRDIATTAGVLGNFIEARPKFFCESAEPMVLAMSVQEEMDVRTLLSYLMEASLCEVRRSEFDSSWRVLPWLTAPAATYTIPIHGDDILDPVAALTVEVTPDSDVLSGVRVAYGYDAANRGYDSETSISDAHSSGGYAFHHLRDGAPYIVDPITNDYIDWGINGAATPLATLSPFQMPAGLYSQTTLGPAISYNWSIKDIASKRTYTVAPVGQIFSGVGGNNIFRLRNPGGSFLAFSVTPGTYSLPALAAAVQTAGRTVDSTFFCTAPIDPASGVPNLFTVGFGSGTAWKMVFHDFTAQSADGWPALGFDNGCSVATSWLPAERLLGGLGIGSTGVVADYERIPGYWYIAGLNVQLQLLWATGGQGLNGTRRNIAGLLGFDTNANSMNQSSYLGACPRKERETPYLNSNAMFGKKREVNVDGRALYDTATALELRNRLTALKAVPRAEIRFSTEIHADMEIGDVFTMDTSVNSLQPYAGPNTGGLWTNKQFRTLETVQSFGSSWHTEVVAVDLTNPA